MYFLYQSRSGVTIFERNNHFNTSMTVKTKWIALVISIFSFTAELFAQIQFVHSVRKSNDFNLSSSGKPVPLYGSNEDHIGVIRALGDLQSDLARVTDSKPQLFTNKTPEDAELVI